MQGGQSLSDVGRTLSDIYGGSDQKAAKIFAMGFYLGLERYDATHPDHRIGQIASAADTLDRHVEALLEASDDERSLANVSRDIRSEIGDVSEVPSLQYAGEDALLPYMHAIVTRNKLIGNNFRDVGLGMIERLDKLNPVKGDSSNGKYLREFNEIKGYFESLAGDVQ